VTGQPAAACGGLPATRAERRADGRRKGYKMDIIALLVVVACAFLFGCAVEREYFNKARARRKGGNR
jgi:hypothetical protein